MTADEAAQFDARGYVVFDAVRRVPGSVVRALEALFERAGENSGHEFRADPFVRHVEIAVSDSGAFAILLQEPQVLECVRARLDSRFELAALQGRSVNPFALASDVFVSASGAGDCRVLWPLDDCGTEGAAALRAMSGSHRAAMAAAEIVNVAAPAGSAIVLDGKLWTAWAANPCSRHLRMLVCDYRRAER